MRITSFRQSEKGTSNINNYSIVTIVEFAKEKIVIPGDIEATGWGVLLGRNTFRDAISDTTILVASHHGREAGFCKELFDCFNPDVVIVSDGRVLETDATTRYYNHAKGTNVERRSGGTDRRYVLTTRKDGPIHVGVNNLGKYITVD